VRYLRLNKLNFPDLSHFPVPSVVSTGYPELDPSGLVTASHDQPAYDAFQHLASQKVRGRVCTALPPSVPALMTAPAYSTYLVA
jgi:hypothetical protein